MGLFSKEALERLEREERAQQKRTVLIVDDEEHNLTTLKFTLSRSYDVLTASDGQEALELLRNDPHPARIHLIISDQRMPRMTGVEFLTQSIAIIPHAIRVVLTGFTDVDAIMDSINEARIYKFVLKPFDEHDILLTMRRGLELYDLEERNRRLAETLEFFNGQFFNHMRNILQDVSGSTELLARQASGGPAPDQEQLLGQMGNSINSLVQMFNRASDLSYAYTGDKPVEIEELDVIALVRERGEFLAARVAGADLALDCRWEAATGGPGDSGMLLVEADQELLSKALDEVLDNAFTYSDKPARITVTVGVEAEGATISVRDHGIGFENEGGHSLLKPFARGARSGEFQAFGFGFGLAYAKTFLELQRGELFFSQEDEGSAVVLRLPLPDYFQGSPYPDEPAPRKIAVFQERPEDLTLLREALEEDGHEVLACATPEALVESVAGQHPHLVLMDGACAGTTTEATMKQIAALGLMESAPVIILAEESAQPARQAFMDSGAHSFVAKPVDYPQLTTLVRQLL